MMHVPPSERRVLIIAGLWYSATSLLNVFLNSQSGVRGLGEAYHLYSNSKDCYCSCGKWLKDCPFYADIRGGSFFYGDCFEKLGCSVLVDASKDVSNVMLAYDPHLSYGATVLSKTPHAWLYSHLRHHPEAHRDLNGSLDYYMRFYQSHLQRIRDLNLPYYCTTYRQLTLDTEETMQKICNAFAIPYSAQQLLRCWDTDTHIAGGNAAVLYQLKSAAWFFEKDEKYRNKERQIFLDEAWSQDTAFMSACLDLYRARQTELDPLLSAIGQENVCELTERLERRLSPISA